MFVNLGLEVRVDKLLGISVGIGNPLVEGINVVLGLAVDLCLELSDLGIEVSLHLSVVLLHLGTEVGGSVVKDTFDVVAGFADLLLSELGVGGVLLAVELLPVCARSGKPFVDNLGVVAVADESIANLASELLHSLLEFRVRIHILGVHFGSSGHIVALASVSAVLEGSRSLKN